MLSHLEPEILSSGLGSIPKDQAMSVMIPLIIILLIVLVAALYNWVAMKELGSIQALFIIQDKKYKSKGHWDYHSE